MYLDNSLNKLLPSCLLLPLLLRVISVLIVFLSIQSHCFSGLFLCYFLSTEINYEHPSELGARDIQVPERGVLLHDTGWTCVWEHHTSGCLCGHTVSFQHHSPNWTLKVPPSPTFYCFHLVVYALGSLPHSTWYRKRAQPGFNVSVPFRVGIQTESTQPTSQFVVNTKSCCALVCGSQASDKPTFPGWLATLHECTGAHAENTAVEQGIP